jgi:hypothetical protein
MFSKYLFLDDVRLPRGSGSTNNPSFESIDTAIRQLDGKSVRNVIVAEGPPSPGDDYPFSGRAISIGGANDRYVVEHCDDRGNVQYFLREGAELGHATVPVMRGRVVDFDEAQLVPLNDVLRVLAAFYEDGTLAEWQRWIE